MGSDMSMEIANFQPRRPKVEWEDDELVIYKDYPISGWSEVWRGKPSGNKTENELIKVISGQEIPEKPIDNSLNARLNRAIESLQDLYKEKLEAGKSGHPESLDAINEQRRIAGKIEGVKLAISYLEEENR